MRLTLVIKKGGGTGVFLLNFININYLASILLDLKLLLANLAFVLFASSISSGQTAKGFRSLIMSSSSFILPGFCTYTVVKGKEQVQVLIAIYSVDKFVSGTGCLNSCDQKFKL